VDEIRAALIRRELVDAETVVLVVLQQQQGEQTGNHTILTTPPQQLAASNLLDNRTVPTDSGVAGNPRRPFALQVCSTSGACTIPITTNNGSQVPTASVVSSIAAQTTVRTVAVIVGEPDADHDEASPESVSLPRNDNECDINEASSSTSPSASISVDFVYSSSGLDNINDDGINNDGGNHEEHHQLQEPTCCDI
jgi:hypothetical protein